MSAAFDTQAGSRESAAVGRYAFEPRHHEAELIPLLEALRRASTLDQDAYHRLVTRFPKAGGGAFSKSELIRAFRCFAPSRGWQREERSFLRRMRMKPVRTASGVAPVTVLTRPYPCPGHCVFCPSDTRMPKSYLAREPGAQRAERQRFDPFRQVLSRLLALHNNGHPLDKIELIVLGGTWSSYRESYQIGFVSRCFDALNGFSAATAADLLARPVAGIDFRDAVPLTRSAARSYNEVVAEHWRRGSSAMGGTSLDTENATWEELAAAQRRNESAAARCVGLVVETRPDHLDEDEALRLRRLGVTKIQLGVQSLDDEVLALNRRGHDVAASRRALTVARRAGFKVQVHWMPNLLGADAQRDRTDFQRLFTDPAMRPDELKIYPCSLIESSELMDHFAAGAWRPYPVEELSDLLADCLPRVPAYCRVNRVVRDIPGDEIVAGSRVTNLRQLVEARLLAGGRRLREIRSREVRHGGVAAADLKLRGRVYRSRVGAEVFLQWVTDDDRLAGFCRLTLPRRPSFVRELAGAAVLREVHVYGGVVPLGERRRAAAQHAGLGTELIEAAAELATRRGFRRLAVISAVGTREYYRRRGFSDGILYQHRTLREVA